MDTLYTAHCTEQKVLVYQNVGDITQSGIRTSNRETERESERDMNYEKVRRDEGRYIDDGQTDTKYSRSTLCAYSRRIKIQEKEAH